MKVSVDQPAALGSEILCRRCSRAWIRNAGSSQEIIACGRSVSGGGFFGRPEPSNFVVLNEPIYQCSRFEDAEQGRHKQREQLETQNLIKKYEEGLRILVFTEEHAPKFVSVKEYKTGSWREEAPPDPMSGAVN